MRQEVFSYLLSKFEDNIKYTEKEINTILTKWSTKGDYFILRRGLIENKLLSRMTDGREYWKNLTRMEKGE